MLQIRVFPRYLLCLSVLSYCLASAPSTVRFDGLGPAKIGMNLSQLNAVLHTQATMPATKDQQGCFYVNSNKHPHIAFMMVDEHLARIDVNQPGVSTAKGIQVGDSESHALEVYGHRLEVIPHKYLETGRYLTIKSNDGRYGIRFETDEGKITKYYAGRYDAIQYVEGCQ
jgi:hypothetical protein